MYDFQPITDSNLKLQEYQYLAGYVDALNALSVHIFEIKEKLAEKRKELKQ